MPDSVAQNGHGNFEEWKHQLLKTHNAEDTASLLRAMDKQEIVVQPDDAAAEYPLDHDATCEPCQGTGLAWLGALGVGDDGRQCPYCFPFRAMGLPTGHIDPQVRTLPYERETGRRWFQHWDDLTRAPTVPPDGPRALRRLPSGPIARPRIRTEPMPSNWAGRVRHFTRHFTGPQTRWRRQKVFMEAYPYLRADLQRRERRRKVFLQWLFIIAQGALIGACVAMVVIVFILAWRDLVLR
jgi:hypothetical protein